MVEYDGSSHTLALSSSAVTVYGLLKCAASALDLPVVPNTLLFCANPCDRAFVPVRSDETLRNILRFLEAGATGRLVIPAYRPFLTVDQFMKTFLRAVLDTPVARRELAAFFLAASGAWEHAVREYGWRRCHALMNDHSVDQTDLLVHAAHSPSGSTVDVCVSAGRDEKETKNSGCELETSAAARPIDCLPGGGFSDRKHARKHFTKQDSRGDGGSGPHEMSIQGHSASFYNISRYSKWFDSSTCECRDSTESCNAVPWGTDDKTRVNEMTDSQDASWSPENRNLKSTPSALPSETPARTKVREYLWRSTEAGCDAIAEQRALACFCTHNGHACAACHLRPIEGPRYVCKSCSTFVDVNLCYACRRAGAHMRDDCRITVYDHPWESDEEYTAATSSRGSLDLLKVPRAPLSLGDSGPRVVHLQYVLYKMGYLTLRNRALSVGIFCEETQRTIRRFQEDHQLLPEQPLTDGQCASCSTGMPISDGRDEAGVFTALTRLTILNLFREVELRYSRMRCGPPADTSSTHLRFATAA